MILKYRSVDNDDHWEYYKPFDQQIFQLFLSVNTYHYGDHDKWKDFSIGPCLFFQWKLSHPRICHNNMHAYHLIIWPKNPKGLKRLY